MAVDLIEADDLVTDFATENQVPRDQLLVWKTKQR